MYGKHRRSVIVRRGLEGWIMTYGDMMSLLLTFFILIVSFSTIQESKFNEAVSSLQEAFGVLTSQDSVIELNRPVVPERQLAVESEVMPELRRLERSLLIAGLADAIEVETSDEGVAFRISAPFLFPSGEATLKADTQGLLTQLADFFARFGYEVQIEGHTDTVPISTPRYPSNWYLSAARAVAVAGVLQRLGVPPERISATGFGEYRPIADNTTAAGKTKNRRVEIFLQVEAQQINRGGLPLQPIVPIIDPTAPGSAAGSSRGDAVSAATSDRHHG